MSDGLTPAQLDEIEATAKKATPGEWVHDEDGEVRGSNGESLFFGDAAGYGLPLSRAIAEHVAMMDPATTLALVARVKDLEAQAEGATQQPVIDTLYGEGASGDLWRTALGLERTYAGFCETGDHYCLQSVGHYCQGGQQFIEAIEEEEA